MISQRGSFALQGTNIRMPNRYKIRSVKATKHPEQCPIISINNQANQIGIKKQRKKSFNGSFKEDQLERADKNKAIDQIRKNGNLNTKYESQKEYRGNTNPGSHQNVVTHSYISSNQLCNQIQLSIREKILRNRSNFMKSQAKEREVYYHSISSKNYEDNTTFCPLVETRKLQKTQYVPHSVQKRVQRVNESSTDFSKNYTQYPNSNQSHGQIPAPIPNLHLNKNNQHNLAQSLAQNQVLTKQEQQILLKSSRHRQQFAKHKSRSQLEIDSQRGYQANIHIHQSQKNELRQCQPQQNSSQDQTKRGQTVKQQRTIHVKNSKIVMSKKNFAIGTDGKSIISLVKQKRCACGDCQECIKDFTYFLRLFSDDNSVPQISAKSWCIWKRKPNVNQNKFTYYYGKRIHKVREIASLSKMITAMVMMDHLNRYNLDPKKIPYEIKKNALVIGGTSANLQLGQVWTLYDLLFGMMLPSGNDAAIAISECIGLMIHLKNKNKQFDPYYEEWYLPYKNKNYSYLFIMTMNEKCLKSGTLDTHMYNSHGNDAFDQLKNVSTCNQITKLSSEFMNYPLLKEVVTTKKFKNWENTNKLLSDGFQGIKTGITETAGPCLAACYKDFIIVVLNSKSMNQRWIQVKKLVKWIINKTNKGT